MKKKSLLLAVSAMSIAAIGVGTVGTFAWFYSTAAVSAKGVAGDVNTMAVTTLGGIKLGVSISGVTGLHLTDDSGNEKAYNGAGTLATLATYGKTTTEDNGHKKAVVTFNVAVDANGDSDYDDDNDATVVPAATLAQYAGTYSLVLKSESDSSFDTTFSADASSRLRMVKESNLTAVYSETEGADLTLSVVIDGNGQISIESGSAADSPTYNVWVSADGSAVDKDYTGTANHDVRGRISIKSGLTA